MKRVNIGIKEETHQLAKIIATIKRITLNTFFQRAIEDAVKKESQVLEKLKRGGNSE